MSDNKQEPPPPWWQTVPGILTAVGTFITAIAGLLVALNQVGLMGQPQPASQPADNRPAISAATVVVDTPPTATSQALQVAPTPAGQLPAADTATVAPVIVAAPTSTAPSPSGGTQQYPITLAPGAEATAGEAVYKVMAAQIEQPSTDRLALRITLRMVNNGQFPTNFWGRSARLIIDGVPEAPYDAPNEVVDAQDSKQGVFLFDIPDSASTVELQVGEVGGETARISIELK
jgi:hypothetical protein